MKILMINGSPCRAGNTSLALQALQEKLKADHEVELLQSYSMTVTPCFACYQCKTNGGYCVQKNDTNAMLQKISEADCVVFGTPVFWLGIAGQLKLFIDKFIARQDVFRSQSKKIVSLVRRRTQSKPICSYSRTICKYLQIPQMGSYSCRVL